MQPSIQERLFCYICNNLTQDLNYNIVLEVTKYSHTPVINILEKFLDEITLDRNKFQNKIICKMCLSTFNDYDLAVITAHRAENDLMALISNIKECNDIESIEIIEETDDMVDHYKTAATVLETEAEDTLITDNILTEHSEIVSDNLNITITQTLSSESIFNCENNGIIVKEEDLPQEFTLQYDEQVENNACEDLNSSNTSIMYFVSENEQIKDRFDHQTSSLSNENLHFTDSLEISNTSPSNITLIDNVKCESTNEHKYVKSNNDNTILSGCLEKRLVEIKESKTTKLNGKRKTITKDKLTLPNINGNVVQQELQQQSQYHQEENEHQNLIPDEQLQQNSLENEMSEIYHCTKCDLIFGRKTELANHLKESHTQSLVCDICGQQYKSIAALEIHVGLHMGVSPHQCKICHKRFTQKGALVRHMPLHTGEHPYQCDKCGKQFIHYSSFHMHQLAHDDIRTKKCTICGLKLRSNSHLNRHMRVHSGEKPYECPTCGQKFAQRYNMMTHYKAHQGIHRIVNKYTCNICKQGFSKQNMLEAHVKLH